MCGVPYERDYQKIFEDVIVELKKGFITLNDALEKVNAGMKRDCFRSHITKEQKAIMHDIIEKNQRDHHRTGAKYLGTPCRFGHEHLDTGKTLRYVSNAMCVICHNQQESKQKLIIDTRIPTEELLKKYPLTSDTHYLGRICHNNHKYHGENYSVRYKCNNMCIICHRRNLHLESGKKRIDGTMSNRIRASLKKGKEGRGWEECVNYTLQDLINHLQLQFNLFMTWDNYGSYWHLDHIIPKSYFEYTSTTDQAFKDCWGLDNLQPLESYVNMMKSNKRSRKYGNL